MRGVALQLYAGEIVIYWKRRASEMIIASDGRTSMQLQQLSERASAKQELTARLTPPTNESTNVAALAVVTRIQSLALYIGRLSHETDRQTDTTPQRSPYMHSPLSCLL